MSVQETTHEQNNGPINPGSIEDYLATTDRTQEEAFGEWCLLVEEFRESRAEQLKVSLGELHEMSEQEIQARLNLILLDQPEQL